jgi:uncharacterized protein YecE (DUF72 family)
LINIGTMGWSYPFWAGNFYPKGLGQEGFLEEYARHFSTVEVDSTYYRIPSDSRVGVWDESTPEGFIFAAKFPKKITHERRFVDASNDARFFIKRMEGLGEKLGPLLLQLPTDFSAGELPALAEFLGSLPEGRRYVVEAKGRQPDAEVLKSLLKEWGVALAVVDSPQVPRIEALTAGFYYVRLEGDWSRVKGVSGKVEVDRKSDIARWGSRLREMAAEAGEVFVYCSKHYSGHSPSDALMLKRLLSTS